MRVLFITNVFNFYIVREPLGLEYLSAAAKAAGHNTRFCGTKEKEYRPAINNFKPDVIGYSITTGQHDLFIKLNEKLKNEFHFTSIFGGPHATFWPEIIDEPGVDAICRGEGEQAFIDFLSRLEKGEDWENTPNWWVKKDGCVYKNDVRNLTENLDEFLWPDRESVFKLSKDAKDAPVKCFVPNRGCPYNCSYCFNEAYWEIYLGKGARVRTRKPENLCEEINHVKKISNLGMPMFTADIFGFTKKWLADFSDVYKENVNLPFHCNVRANMVDDQYAQLLAKGGCASVAMGIEAGNDEIRNELFCRGQSKEQIIGAAKALAKMKIAVVSYNILGVPGTSLASDLETLELNRKCGVDYAATFTLIPLPKTKIYDWMVKKGLMDPVSYDENYSYYGLSSLPIEDRVKRGRLYYLFALALSFEWVNRLLPTLLKLPLDPMYRFAFRIFRGWNYKRKLFPVSQNISWTLRAIWRYLTFEHR